ncbi:hypothetical protein FEP14_03625 [Burkholderia multivorans]|nr:hypothetical protein [Burkholderia multivorans]
MQVCIGCDPAMVRDIAALHGDVAIAANDAALCAVRGGACRIGQLTAGRHCQAVAVERRNPTRRVVQRRAGYRHTGCALDGPSVVRDGSATDGHRGFGYQFAGLVGDLACDVDRQLSLRRHLAALVRQVATGQRRAAAARQAAVVVDHGARCVRLNGGLRARRRVRQIHVAGRRVQRQIAVRGSLAAREIHTAARQRCVTARYILAGRGQLARRGQVQVSAVRDRTVVVHTRAERAGRVDAAGIDRRILLRRERPAVRQIGRSVRRQRLLRIRGAAILDAARG